MSGELVERATLESVLAQRDTAFRLAEEAADAYRAFLAKVGEARAVANRTTHQDYAFNKLADLIPKHHGDPDKLRDKMRRDLDEDLWQFLLRHTGMSGLMDKQALDEFNRELSSDPPEVTADNVRATFLHMKENSRAIFRRGLVNVFKKLAREYRSHDGFKLGSRIIVEHVAGDHHYNDQYLTDADRIIHILDGEQIGPGWSSDLYAWFNHTRRTAWRSKGSHWSSGGKSVAVPGEVNTAYWRLKWFQNGNGHLYCKRPDLLRRLNRLIAEFYEDAVGAGPDAAGARRYTRAKPHHHEVEDFYPTSAAVAERMVELAGIRPGMDVCEPSAGEGSIVRSIMSRGVIPDCIEIDPGRAEILRDMLPPGAVVQADFLAMEPEPTFDAMVLNPPFGLGAGIQHVFHAIRFLKPGGRLVAVLGDGYLTRSDGPTAELRRLVAEWRGTVERLPAGSFRHAGTEVGTVLIALNKPVGALPALSVPAAAPLLDAAE